MLAIVAAFREEIKDYLKQGEFRRFDRQGCLRFYLSRKLPDVVVVEGAFAREGAQEATRRVIERYRPRAVISPGFAGGARVGLRPGDIFLCDKLLCVEGPAAFWRTDAAQELQVGDAATSLVGGSLAEDGQEYAYGKCITVPQFVSSTSMKRWIGYTFGASVIDMESFWVGQVAAECGVPLLVARSVFDPMEQTLPNLVGELIGKQGLQTLRHTVRYTAGHPLEASKLVRLAAQSRAARASLSNFLQKLAPRSTEALDFAVDAR